MKLIYKQQVSKAKEGEVWYANWPSAGYTQVSHDGKGYLSLPYHRWYTLTDFGNGSYLTLRINQFQADQFGGHETYTLYDKDLIEISPSPRKIFYYKEGKGEYLTSTSPLPSGNK